MATLQHHSNSQMGMRIIDIFLENSFRISPIEYLYWYAMRLSCCDLMKATSSKIDPAIDIWWLLHVLHYTWGLSFPSSISSTLTGNFTTVSIQNLLRAVQPVLSYPKLCKNTTTRKHTTRRILLFTIYPTTYLLTTARTSALYRRTISFVIHGQALKEWIIPMAKIIVYIQCFHRL
jgi:hypothetical protein